MSKSSVSVRVLSAHPSLEYLKKEAKRLLEREQKKHPKMKLAEAQLMVAREYGFTSWRAMKAQVEARLGAHVKETHLPLAGRRQGKVRDIYDAGRIHGHNAVLLIASDRLSAFDVVMPNGIPGKGIILTQLSNFWFKMIQEKLSDKLRHHVLSADAKSIPGLSPGDCKLVERRSVVGMKTRVIPIECVVRGYLAGSGWSEYRRSGKVCGVTLPKGLKQSEQLPEPIFTPTTKATEGHDEAITFDRMGQLVGLELSNTLRTLSIAIYKMAHDYAKPRGIVIADTKFEFGLEIDSLTGEPINNQPILVDEVLTPDSSRFWPVDDYKPGTNPPSFDKQAVRDYLQELFDQGKWNKAAPGPVIPDDVVDTTLHKYLEAYRLITGRTLEF
jgi:phosphoribosylaminoimidazole-succinocarboxamide synthase